MSPLVGHHSPFLSSRLLNYSPVLNVSAYVPDGLLPQFEAVRDGLLTWLKTFGIIKGSPAGGESAGMIHSTSAFTPYTPCAQIPLVRNKH